MNSKSFFLAPTVYKLEASKKKQSLASKQIWVRIVAFKILNELCNLGHIDISGTRFFFCKVR